MEALSLAGWLVCALIIAAALFYGYWAHTNDSRHLAREFALLAKKYQGEVKAGSLLAYPQLRFEKDSRGYLVTAMATSGADTGDDGPFTFVDLNLPFDTGERIRVKRSTGGAKRLIAAITPGKHSTTGHKEFDEAFRVEASDQASVSSLLAAQVRHKLLTTQIAKLDIRVAGQKITVYGDGIVKSQADLEDLIDIADLVADHCPRTR